MAYNKVIYGGNTLVDLTDSTVEPRNVEYGKVFYDAGGTQQTGIAYTCIPMELVDIDTSGMTLLYEASNLEFDATANTIIDTGIAFFSEENISKDFHILMRGLYIDTSKGSSGTTGQRCLLGAMYEVSPWPGFVLRGGSNAGGGVVTILNQTHVPFLSIGRVNGEMTFSSVGIASGTITAPTQNTNINSGTIARAGNMGNCTTVHDTTLTLGCEKDKDGSLYRFAAGSIEHIAIYMAD